MEFIGRRSAIPPWSMQQHDWLDFPASMAATFFGSFIFYMRALKSRHRKYCRGRKMLAPSRLRAVEKAISASSVISLPSFLVPAFHVTSSATRRSFSATAIRPSKLGRTPISIPPGVEILIGPPKVKEDPTTYLRIPKRTVTVSGPLGMNVPAGLLPVLC